MPRKPSAVPCPRCKGTGTITLTVIQRLPEGTTKSESHLACDTCNGAKTVTRARANTFARQQQYWEQMWCRCEGDVDVDYYADGEHEEIEKHHWRCKSCGKVRQIG